MWLPGHIEMWNTIVHMGNYSVTQLPRDQIIGFGHVCQDNVMYSMYKSFYLGCSWSMSLLFKAYKPFIDQETLDKIIVTPEDKVAELVELYHPCQLEKRFGGTMDTPTSFWPPYVGKDFTPPGQE